MQPLEEQILIYLYILNKKYQVDFNSLARLCYKMQRHVRVVGPAVDILAARGFLNSNQDGYAISKKGIDLIEYKGLVKIRNWVVEE